MCTVNADLCMKAFPQAAYRQAKGLRERGDQLCVLKETCRLKTWKGLFAETLSASDEHSCETTSLTAHWCECAYAAVDLISSRMPFGSLQSHKAKAYRRLCGGAPDPYDYGH